MSRAKPRAGGALQQRLQHPRATVRIRTRYGTAYRIAANQPGQRPAPCPVSPDDRFAALDLRPLQPRDTEALVALANDRRVSAMVTRMPAPYLRLHASRFIGVGGFGPDREHVFAVTVDGGFRGCIGIRREAPGVAEIGYWLGRPFWGMGIATASVKAIVCYGTAVLGHRAVTAGHFNDNPASRRVLEKAGFKATGSVEQHFSQARRAIVSCTMMVHEAPGADIR